MKLKNNFLLNVQIRVHSSYMGTRTKS